MKRYLMLIALMAMSLLYSQNLLKNPAMKELAADGKPVGWGVFPGTVLERPGLDGADFTISKSDGKDATLTYHFKLDPYIPYIMTFQYKGEEGAILYAYAEWSTKKGESVEHGGSYQEKNPGRTPVKPGWQTMTISFSLPENLNSCYLALRSMNGKKLSFKNLTIRKGNIREETNVGGFWNLESLKKYDDKSISIQGGKTATLFQIPVTPGTNYRLSYTACGNGPVPADYPFHEISTQIVPKVQGTFSFNDVSNTPQGKTLAFSIPKDSDIKRISVKFTVKAKEAVFVDFSDFKLETIVPDPKAAWRLEVIKPFYRNTIYESQPLNEIVCRLITNGDEASKCKVDFYGRITENAIDKSGTTMLTIPVNGLPNGSYTLDFTVSDNNGKELRAFKEIIHKVPKAPMEIIGQPNRYFSINGKPFFPIVLWSIRSMTDDYIYYCARHGVNVTITHFGKSESENLARLDLLNKYGIKAIVGGGYCGKTTDETLKAFRERLAQKFTPAIRNHPAFF
ncbi:MAG: hypothetical protein J6X55_04020, partial [Victivallales bacterium]|nr:hypothetical protein [Victivallales bacterium]